MYLLQKKIIQIWYGHIFVSENIWISEYSPYPGVGPNLPLIPFTFCVSHIYERRDKPEQPFKCLDDSNFIHWWDNLKIDEILLRCLCISAKSWQKWRIRLNRQNLPYLPFACIFCPPFTFVCVTETKPVWFYIGDSTAPSIQIQDVIDCFFLLTVGDVCCAGEWGVSDVSIIVHEFCWNAGINRTLWTIS